jgi:hypothetical protein
VISLGIYIAVNACPPAAKGGVVNVATPPTNATGVPELTPSTINCTVPVGVVAGVVTSVTVAVSATPTFEQEGLAVPEVKSIFVASCATKSVCVKESKTIAKKATALPEVIFLISLYRIENRGIVLSIVAQFIQVSRILIRFRKSFGSI